MNLPLTAIVQVAHQTFLYSEPILKSTRLKADIAFLGIPYGDAYTAAEIVNDQSNMPTAMRQVSDRIVRSLERYDSTSAARSMTADPSARWIAATCAPIRQT